MTEQHLIDPSSITLADFLKLDEADAQKVFCGLSVNDRLAFIRAFCDFIPEDILNGTKSDLGSDDPLRDILVGGPAARADIDKASFVSNELKNKPLSINSKSPNVVPIRGFDDDK